MTGLVFLHGWGYGPFVWEAWTAASADRPVVLLDAGYFGPQQLEIPDNPDGWVGIGHSQGFARLLEMNLPWRGLVGLCGFLRFCRLPGQPDRPGGTSPELLDAMLARLDQDPADVLRRFTRRCGQQADCPEPPQGEGLQRLREGLLYLRGLDLPTPERATPTLLVHARDDRIVPLELAQEAQSRLSDTRPDTRPGARPGARLEVFETGGHVLPFTRTADCLRTVREFLHELG